MNYRECVDRIIGGDMNARISVFVELQDKGISVDVLVDGMMHACTSAEEMAKLHIAITETLAAMQALRAVVSDNCFIMAITMIYRYRGDREQTDNIISVYEQSGYVGDYPTAWRMLMELHRLQAVPGELDTEEYRNVVLKYATPDTMKELTERPTPEVTYLSINPLTFIASATKH